VGTRLAVSDLVWLLVAAVLVGMYLRTTRRKNQDGTVVRYVQLVHNRRVEGVTQAQVLVNLGREDQLDRDGLGRLVTSINRYLGVSDVAPSADARQLAGDGLTVSGSRPVGAVHLLDGLWRVLEIDTALGKVLGPRRFTTNVERVLFALVANRAAFGVLPCAARKVIAAGQPFKCAGHGDHCRVIVSPFDRLPRKHVAVPVVVLGRERPPWSGIFPIAPATATARATQLRRSLSSSLDRAHLRRQRLDLQLPRRGLRPLRHC
jgi:hypothetical protein